MTIKGYTGCARSETDKSHRAQTLENGEVLNQFMKDFFWFKNFGSEGLHNFKISNSKISSRQKFLIKIFLACGSYLRVYRL